MNPGTYEGIPFNQYLNLEACSHSQLEDLRQSPAHCRFRIDNPEPETPALKLGSAADLLILQPDLFFKTYVSGGRCEAETENKRQCTRQGTEFIDGEFRCFQHSEKRKGDQIVLSPQEWEVCRGMKQAVENHQKAFELLSLSSAVQVTSLWNDSGFAGLPCKSRPDIVCDELSSLVDLKTTIDASPQAFARDIFKYGYHRQAYFYLRGQEQLGQNFAHYCIIAVEKEAPYCVAVYRITEEAIDLAKREVLPLMEAYHTCQSRDEWPGYPEEVIPIGLPKYAESVVNEIEIQRLMTVS